MKVNIHPSWKSVLQTEFEKPYFQELIGFVASEYATNVCYPEEEEIFSAFNRCPLDKVKIVIIGQDPYHGPGQAHGLCFSVQDGIPHPPSLRNIFKEIVEDIGTAVPESGCLNHWADQGVLLLNATLTVRQSEAGSHQKKGWEQFTDEVIRKVSEENEKVVFMLWGGFAKKKVKLVDRKKHFVLESGHPSPLSANRGYWFGNKHFSRANQILEENGLNEVEW